MRADRQTDGQTDAQGQNNSGIDPDQEHTYGRKRFLLPVTYFSAILVYTFTGIICKNANHGPG